MLNICPIIRCNIIWRARIFWRISTRLYWIWTL